MRTIFGFLAVLCVCAAVSVAQPVIDPDGVLNGASYVPSGLPNSGIAQGSIFIIKGNNLGPDVLDKAGFPLPLEFRGTNVKVTVQGQTVDAPILYTWTKQVAALLPSNTPRGNGMVTVIYNNRFSAPAPITVVQQRFGIFTINSAGSGPAVITDPDYQVNTLTFAARPNDVLVLWGTGLGPVFFNETEGAPVQDLDYAIEVYVGGKRADLTFKGRAPTLAGVDQINFRVPPGVVEGCYVPVVVRVGGVVSNVATMSIASGKRTCSDPLSYTEEELEKGRDKDDLRTGTLMLNRAEVSLGTIPGLGELVWTLDDGRASFHRHNFRKLIGSIGAATYPPFGQCLVFPFQGQNYEVVYMDPSMPEGLDAGKVTVTGPKGEKELKLVAKGEYEATLGGGGLVGMPGTLPDYLVKGAYTANVSGGAEVGAFTATLNFPDPLKWDNRAGINEVSRAQDLRVTWSGGDAAREFVTILGFSMRNNPQVGAAFVCTERAAAGGFTLPSLVLSALPDTDAPADMMSMPNGMLILGNSLMLGPSRFQAGRLDGGHFTYVVTTGKAVTYK